jgi:hypothetical protein
MDPAQREAALRAALFIKPESKEDLARWIRIYLGIDLPSHRVDPDSNSSPMELVWELYDACRRNDPNYQQVMAYAARDSFKTFASAIFEVLCIMHLERSVAHMAAIEPQAKKCQQYLKKHLNRPFIREYVTSRNERTVEVTRFFNEETGDNLTVQQFNALLAADQVPFREIKNYVNIVICTIQGANSEHTPIMVVDEVDVVENHDAYEEAKMIPAPLNDMMPMTLYTSTRKYSWGLVQKEIDNAAETGLLIRHWNLIDVTRPCPPDRHLPNLPKIPIYRSDQLLTAKSEADYNLLDNAEKAKFVKDEGYAGCLQNCRIFASCRGLLATRDQTPNSFLKPVQHTQGQFRKVTLDKAKSQLLCRKPSLEGLIYPNFSRDIHMLSIAEMIEMISGEPAKPGADKASLIAILKERGARFVAGMDHGYSHNFAVVIGALFDNRMFILDVIAQPQLELGQKVSLCQQRVTPFNPDTWADTSYPADNKTLKREAQLRIRDWKKGPGSVKDGISIVRLALMPTMAISRTEARLFFIKGDEGCELLAARMGQYHWKTDAAGRVTDDPGDENDDELDALRYLVMNVMDKRGVVSFANVNLTPGLQDSVLAPQIHEKQYDSQKWMQQIIAERTGIDTTPDESPAGSGGKSGRFSWNL